MNNRFLALGLILFFIQCCNAQRKPDDMKPFDYEKAWKEVSNNESKALPESALKVVNEIYSHAKTDSNTGQLVKAVVYQLKFTDYKEENGFIKNLNKLKDEADQASFPAKPLLHSMLAEMYWQYYQNNRYEFINRSETINVEENDIETWSLPKIVQETLNQYTISLVDSDKSKTEKIDIYSPVLYSGNELGHAYRPTLYDFLAHRALEFFSSQEAGITKPVYAFAVDKEEYLAGAKEFVDIKLTSKDSLSMIFHAMIMFQDLIRFHLNDKEPDAVVDVDLARLQFVRTHLTLPNKNDLYLKTLDQLEASVLNKPVVGKVTVEKAKAFFETASLYNSLQGDDHKWDFKKAYALCEGAKKRFPDSDGAIMCENLQDAILTKSISASIEENNIPGTPFRSLVHYKNFTDLHYRIIKVTREEVQSLRKKLEKDYSSDREQQFLKYFIARSAVKTGNFKLPADGDYQQHSIEVKLDALPEGEYMVLFSHDEKFAIPKNGLAFAFTVISNISYVHRTTKDGGTEFYTLNRQSGEALAGVTVSVYISRYNSSKSIYERVKINTMLSDVNGYCKIPSFKNEDHNSFFADFSKGNDFTSTEPVDRQYYYGGSIYQYKTEEPYTQTQTFFFLDRAIYRPGQTIYFKGLVISTDGKNPKIVPKHSSSISLLDVNHQQRGNLSVTTNEYGTFSGSFTAPSSGLTGEMLLENQDGSGSVSFSVEEYKRPKFEVGFDPVKSAFRLNDKIRIEGYARAYSGANIDGASVKYRVVRAANFPFWWWCRWGYYPSSPEMEITNGLITSDENGKFNIDFSAVPDLSVDKSSDPTFLYTIYADVTDINGETHSSSTTVSVGYKSLLVNASVENINLDEIGKSKNEIQIQTTNLSGEFQPAKGLIKIYSLKAPGRAFRKRLWEQPDKTLYSREEFYALFPHDPFDDEGNKFKWTRSKEVFTVNFDTEKSKSFEIPEVAKWNPGEYVLEITSTDKDDHAVREVSYFTVYATSAKIIPAPAVDYYQAVKVSGEPGEKASFTIGTSEEKVHALYEIERDGTIISKEWLTLKNEQRLFQIPILEEYRGNIAVHVTFIKDNRLYNRSIVVNVPYTNKELDISFESFRDKLQPGENEQWKIIVKGKTADKVAAEMVATLYDASLDEFRVNYWSAGFYNSMYVRMGWKSVNGFLKTDLRDYTSEWNQSSSRGPNTPYFDSFNWFGYNFYRFSRESRRYRAGSGALRMASPMMAKKSEIAEEREISEDKNISASAEPKGPVPEQAKQNKEEVKLDLSDVKVRKNFNETAFFYPQLLTNEKGEIIIKFTIPEALTRWKMLGFAHTKDLKSGMIGNQLVTQKDIMVVPNQPRFFRENDTMKFSAKISSLVDKELAGQAQLEFFDALTMKPVDDLMKNQTKTQNFSLKPRQSTSLEWSIEIPEGIQAIMYRIVAKAGDFSDGEEMVLPVVTNRMLVTETFPLPIRGKQTKEFKFEKLLNNKSTTLKHQRYTLEFTSNPAWYAIQSLPYLMEYPYDCVEQTFSKFYANSIASHIANSNPRIKQVFDTWKNIQPDALLSNLEKNQELKSALLEETPWVLEAKDESQRKRMVGVLFDLNRMGDELGRALDKIKKAQEPGGGFSWFPGFPADRYMTQHIIAGMGHLDVMGVKSVRDEEQTWYMITSAVQFMDARLKYDYDRLLEMAKRKEIDLKDNHIGYIQYHYLYTRSYFKDIAIPDNGKEAFNYFLDQAKKYWTGTNLYMQGMTCLALHRAGDKTVTAAMIKSFSERALHSEEMGMYWKNDYGYYWYQAPIERHALMIEVYDEVAGDIKSVEDMKVWLLKQKQTQDWKTTKATVEACYALLRRGTDVLANTKQVEIKVGNEVVDPTKHEDVKIEAGTGYFKTAWQANAISNNMGDIKITKTDEGVAWGAVYWQYFEQLDKITPAETPLKLKKDLFIQQNTDRGPVITPVNDKTSFAIGDLVKVKIELRVDRDMEYIHLKDMRAAGFEPVSTLSTFKYQDGLYYYESSRDLATNFFIGYLSKGTYVFEYSLRVSQKGNFSNGVTTIQCMYAPEFASHSQGIRVTVK